MKLVENPTVALIHEHKHTCLTQPDSLNSDHRDRADGIGGAK